MILIYLKLIFWVIQFGSPQEVVRRNNAKIRALASSDKKVFKLAALNYNQVLKTSLINVAEVNLNIANCYVALNENTIVYPYAIALSKVEDLTLQTRANAILASLALRERDTLLTLSELKKNLVLNPQDQIASYNFELLSKISNQHFRSKKSAKSSPKKNIKNQNSVSENQILQKNNKQETELIVDKSKNISDQGALNLLNAMKKNEVQFIQQLATKSNSPTKKIVKW